MNQDRLAASDMTKQTKVAVADVLPGETPELARVVQYLLQNFAPRTACIVGCGDGSLVWALKQRGVDAVGVGDGSRIPYRVRVWDRVPVTKTIEEFDVVVVCTKDFVNWSSIQNLVSHATHVLQLHDGILRWVLRA